MAKVYQDGIVPKKSFVKKYFMDGQALDSKAAVEIPEDADFIERALIKYRKYIAVVGPVSVMLTFWFFTAIRYDWFKLYLSHWQLPLTMVLGGSVAGLTAESGGAVAFPVMTLVMHLSPEVARDFSLFIQSCGLLCGLASVIIMRVQLEDRAVFFGIIGSLPGMVFGFKFLNKFLTGSQKKMLFVSIWSSFAMALFLINREKKRKVFLKIPVFRPWKGIILAFAGFVGGILTAFTGSGVDISLFSITTVLFRVSEKSVMPTTIVVMGINSIVGSFFRIVWEADVEDIVFEYVKPSIPVVLLVVPLTFFIGSHFHRQTLAWLVYITEIIAMAGFLLTMPPTPILLIGACIIVIGFIFFYTMGKIGEQILQNIEISSLDDPSDHTEICVISRI